MGRTIQDEEPERGQPPKVHYGTSEQRIRTIFPHSFERRMFLSSLLVAEVRVFGRKYARSSLFSLMLLIIKT